MSIQVDHPPLVVFEDNDRDYLFWTSRNSCGYVVNCYRNPTPDYLILHWGDCYTINGTQSAWTTGDYIGVLDRSLCVGGMGQNVGRLVAQVQRLLGLIGHF